MRPGQTKRSSRKSDFPHRVRKAREAAAASNNAALLSKADEVAGAEFCARMQGIVGVAWMRVVFHMRELYDTECNRLSFFIIIMMD